MPTPVTTARQCLTAEASKGLDEAVTVAKRRGHAQTTSLHVISSFLILPSSSILRDACLRTRNSSYSSNVKFKALELCFNVALDRLPSSQHNGSSGNGNEPPVSNSLMAAIKRSQANQRRNPESYHLYHLQQNQQQSSVSCVKVETQQLVLSILDDPVVSRVFADAGFRSTDIKFSILRPLRYNSSYPPLFLCNLAAGAAAGVGPDGVSVSDYESGRKSFSFPFSGFSEISDGDENCRRIGEILVRKKGRNPLLVGVHAKDAITSFKENVESQKNGVLPVELPRLDFISIESEVMEFVAKNGSERRMGSKFDELSQLVKNSSGVVVSFGDLNGFAGDGSSGGDASSYLISKLTNLVETCSGKLWLMGSTSSYETYLRFITKFPTVEKDWDLQILPTASFRSSIGGYFSKPHSLMESFIPLGGFFSTPPNLAAPLGSTYRPFSRCKLCSDKCEQEVSAVLTVGRTNSQSDQHQASLPAWLQSADVDTNIGMDLGKAKDDKTELHAKVTVLQKKWNDICQCLHHNSSPLEGDVSRAGSQAFPCIMGFPVAQERKERVGGHANTMFDESECDSAQLELPKASEQGVTLSAPVDLKDKSTITLSGSSPQKLPQRPSSKGDANPAYSLSVVLDGHGSPCSAASVTTDLGLGTLYSSLQDPKHPTSQANEEIEVVKGKPLKPHQLQSSSCTGPNSSAQFDSTDFKLFLKSLKEKVGRQDEAIYAVSRTVALCRSGKERRRRASLKGDIWFSFLGSDMVAKKKLAIALAEMLFGSRESVICVDLACPDGVSPPNSIFHSKKMNGFDTSFRGSFIVDYIYSEIRKNPLSVVFLENVDKADTGVHNCLVHAIQTGKFIDSRGREIGINNSVFAVTSSEIKSNETFSFRKETQKFSEEKILVAQGWQMQILIRNDPEYCIPALLNKSNVFVSSRNPSSIPAFLNKRKLNETMETAKRIQKTSSKCLDLNLPVEAASEDSTLASLDNLTSLVDECVVFEPFDFDSLASDILKKMDESYKNTIGNEGFLEVDSQAMEQILAAAWLCDSRNSLDNWVEYVVGSTFAEARERYSVGTGTVLKLVSCEGLPMQDQALEVCLPARIILQ
ncbi:hypothetical protein C5167_047225 [Papaver somniferum]|uniref:Clp R domain-containing protein n=1 Tax=Papaver somniferum TaxID=3469 RepID=A0A4Y7LG10_PAPSO|nr:protein SMAX1-LIKE 7-like [Papaver somniferum]RZC84444.1 hypothetical protein C5167_047225 [Papaver somniferum]